LCVGGDSNPQPLGKSLLTWLLWVGGDSNPQPLGKSLLTWLLCVGGDSNPQPLGKSLLTWLLYVGGDLNPQPLGKSLLTWLLLFQKSFEEPIDMDFQKKYASVVLELETLNKDLNEYLLGVQKYVSEVSKSSTQ
jgi:hypothetical protein